MEQKFNNNRLDLQVLREFCEREGEKIAYRKGDQMEREGDPARWFAFVTEGCFKYVKYGMSDDKHFSMAVRHRPQLKPWCPAVY